MRTWVKLAQWIRHTFGIMPTAEKLVQEGIDRSDDEDYEAAIEVFTRAIATDPAYAFAYSERAMALLNLNRDEEALADFTRALELDPRFPGARDWRARTYGGLGNHRAAAEDWLRVLRDQPDGKHGMGVCPQTWADCAEEFRKAGEPARAVELLEEYLDREAGRVTHYARFETAPLRVLATQLAEDGQVERARQLAAAACASPHHVPADFMLARRLGLPVTWPPEYAPPPGGWSEA